MTTKRPKGLGRGLETLLGADPVDPLGADLAGAATGQGGDIAGAAGAVRQVALEALQPGRYQPRTRMDEASLQDLADSITRHGLMQPIVARVVAPGRYEIIAGERRFRAARLAGLTQLPVIVREASDENALALALIENIQREDLNALEEAQAIQRLLDEFGYTHEEAAQAIGRSRSATSNLLRLLQLAPAVQEQLLAGRLEMGHARALLALDRGMQVLLAHEVSEKRLSVRETETRVAQALASLGANPSRSATGRNAPGQSGGRSGGGGGGSRPARAETRDLVRLQERLSDALAAPVALRVNSRGAGQISFRFADAEQFEDLIQALGLARVLEES